jgi:hypothetical protein
MRERQVRAVAVSGITAKPLGEEALLRLALVVEIACEERSQQRVGFDPVVEPRRCSIERSMSIFNIPQGNGPSCF